MSSVIVNSWIRNIMLRFWVFLQDPSLYFLIASDEFVLNNKQHFLFLIKLRRLSSLGPQNACVIVYFLKLLFARFFFVVFVLF
jgi:hypothetical protein